ncbi:metal-dependent hydrolase family protein [Flavisolibacter tropicus]|uniref:Amidohydrolase n=1 Tax=Flavisolibacter tropicus TaxID=1492898 RepID=A0A172U237_9BACT|nr:amidohydrolase family protein [Flavisolibacter tropicus]ANE53103.1 amidohydrolase [Flavisolibacter tropicus]
MKKLFTLLFSIVSYGAFGQTTYLYCGKLIDGLSATAQQEVTIVVDGNKIIEVQKGYQTPPSGVAVIDLKKNTVMPGLIDSHVHITSETSKNRYTEGFTLNTEDFAFRSVGYAERTLLAGFTTVRDLGGSIALGLRNAINGGYIKGPRIIAAGKIISTTGGHGDPTNGYNHELMGDPDAKDGVINSPDEARKAVRQHYKEGVDVIKITATGGVLSNAKDGAGAQFTEDEIKAIVSTAKDYGFKVAAHAHGAEGMKRAIRAGVTSIEHGTFMDDEVIRLMKQYGTYYVPTITAGKSTADSAKIPGYYPPLVVPKALETGPKIQATFTKAYKAGVKIAFGTDAGVYAHGKNYKEFEYMVEAGMPPMESIKAATVSAADLLGVSDKVGSIEKGKLADIIAVDGDPLQDIKVMGKVQFVMKEGKVYKSVSL